MNINNSGQTLIETLIALTMTVFLLTALVVATTQSIRSSRFAKSQAQATHLAQQQIEELRNIRDRDGWRAFKTLLFVSIGCPVGVPTEFTCERIINENDDTLVDLTIELSWEDRGTHTVRQRTTLTKWAY